jgi:hypothetical protein
MSGLGIFLVVWYGFMFGWAGVLTVRVSEYSFGGQLSPILYPFMWILFFMTGMFLLLLALPLRLLGIKLYPVFVPDSYK